MFMGEAISCLWVGTWERVIIQVRFTLEGPHANNGLKCPYINVIYPDSNLNMSPTLVWQHIAFFYSISNHAKIFRTSTFSYLLFLNPIHKTKIGIANRWKTSNSNPVGPIKLSSQSKQQVLGQSLVPFTSLSKLCKNAWPKPFHQAKPACFDFPSSTEHWWSCSS
jgi:hypothetical protein